MKLVSDQNFSLSSFSVDDILNEVAAMRSGDDERQAPRATDKAVPPQSRKSALSAKATAPTAAQGDGGAPAARPVIAGDKPAEERSAAESQDSPRDRKNDAPAAPKEEQRGDNSGDTAKQRRSAADISFEDLAAAPIKISHKPKTITPDEINKGIESEPFHINQKRRPSVITPEELRSNKPMRFGRQEEPAAADQTIVFSVPEAVSPAAPAQMTEDSSEKVKRQIDALFGAADEIKANPHKAPTPTAKAPSAADIAEPQIDAEKTAVFDAVKPSGKVAAEGDDLSSNESKAERKARMRAEREEELIRKSEEKAARAIQKRLSKSHAAVSYDEYDGAEEMPRDTVRNTTRDTVPFAEAAESADASDDVVVGAADRKADDLPRNDGDLRSKTESAAADERFMTESSADNFEFDAASDMAAFEAVAARKKAEETRARMHSSRPLKAARLEVDQFPKDDEEDDEIDDYRTIEDSESVRAGLDIKRSALTRRAFFSFIWMVLAGLLTAAPCIGMALPKFISPSENTTAFLSVNVILVLLMLITNGKAVINGLVSLIRLRPDIDTAVSVSVVAVLAQSVAAFYSPASIKSGEGLLFTFAASVAVFFNIIGKRCMFTRVRSNFDLVATTGIKQSVFALKDRHSAAVTDNAAADGTTVACSRSVINLHDYLYNSFCEDPSDKINMIIAPIGLATSILSAGVYYVMTKNIFASLGVAAAVASAAVPVSCILAANMPMKKAGRNAKSFGALISGYNAVESFADTEFAVVNDYELFAPGSVDLVNLKATGDNSIDDVMMDAAALVMNAGGPLADVFDRMIGGRSKQLKSVRDMMYTDKKGLSGYVGDDRISVGNRAMIESFGAFDLPDIEVERKLERGGNRIVYIARNDSLCGLLVVKYCLREAETADMLRELADSGVTLLVKTCDPNITAELIEEVFGLYENEVAILSADAAMACEELTVPRESGDSVIAYNKSPAGFFCALKSAKRLKSVVRFAVALQIVGVILGAATAIFACFTGRYLSILPAALAAYQLIFALIAVALPMMRRI